VDLPTIRGALNLASICGLFPERVCLGSFERLLSDLVRGIGFQPVDRLEAYPTKFSSDP
jgi:hypothetical protein